VGTATSPFRYRDGAEVGFDIGFPIDPSDEEVAGRAGLGTGETSAGEAFVHIHRGPYARLGDTYRQMERNMSEQGFKGFGDLWAVYLNDPDECRASDLLTQIVWPVEIAAYA
jgi:effector-binding domain-containing protein